MNKEHEGIPASPLSSATASIGLLLHQQNTVVLGLTLLPKSRIIRGPPRDATTKRSQEEGEYITKHGNFYRATHPTPKP